MSLVKIILGPCAEAATIRRGLVQILEDYGFAEADDCIYASAIPYRQRM